MDTNKDWARQSQNEDNFANFPLRLEFLNEAEKEKNNGKTRHQCRHNEIRFTEQSLLILLSEFRVGLDAQFHWLCYKTIISSCF